MRVRGRRTALGRRSSSALFIRLFFYMTRPFLRRLFWRFRTSSSLRFRAFRFDSLFDITLSVLLWRFGTSTSSRFVTLFSSIFNPMLSILLRRCRASTSSRRLVSLLLDSVFDMPVSILLRRFDMSSPFLLFNLVLVTTASMFLRLARRTRLVRARRSISRHLLSRRFRFRLILYLGVVALRRRRRCQLIAFAGTFRVLVPRRRLFAVSGSFHGLVS